MEFDSSVTQSDIDASGLGAAQSSSSGFADNSDFSEGDSDYTVTGTPTEFRTVQNYTQARGATATNPFPDSIFSRMFGAENVDYTNILGSDGVQDVNNLRYRQGMGLPSLNRPGQDYRMGDFYIGQPTMEGTVKEVPRGGIIDMIPGLSTITNLFGRNRGLPEGSDAFKEAMADSKKSSFQPITDIIDSFTRGVGSLKNIFDTEETNTNTMSMPEAGVRKEVPEFDYGEIPSGFTFGSMPQNAGIVTMAPENKTEADMAVTDAMSNLRTNPIAIIPEVEIDRIPSDIFYSLPTEDDRRERDFIREVLEQRTKSKPTVPVNMDEDGFIKLSDLNPDFLGFGASQIAPPLEALMKKYISPNIEVRGGGFYDKEKEKFNPKLQLNYRFGTV